MYTDAPLRGGSARRRARGQNWPIAPWVLAAVWWLWMPLAYFLVKGIIALTMGGLGVTRQSMHLFMERNFFAADGGVWGLAPQAWLWFIIGLIGTAIIIPVAGSGAGDRRDPYPREWVATVISSVLALVLIYPLMAGFLNNDQDLQRFYLENHNTRVCVKDPSTNAEHPTSLAAVYSQKDAPKQVHHDSHGKVDSIQIGPLTVARCTLPTKIWNFDPRSSSYDGALRSLQTKTSTRSGVNVFDSTLTYVYGNATPAGKQKNVKYPQTNRWSVVLDGSNYSVPMAGVAEWEGGQNTTHVCLYQGSDSMNRAFGGAHSNSLRNVIAKAYPELVYADSDIAGYCDTNDQPVIVIAVTKYVGWRARTVQVPAGILVLRGSPSGFPSVRYQPNVKAGEYPVPVYPLSVAKAQREADDWWAGEGNHDNANYGFSPSTFATQADNSGEYVLHSKTDNGIYAVTPQKPKGKSQELNNEGMIGVDSVRDGHLNQLSSYVMNDGDPNVINPNSLSSSAQSILRQSSFGPAFAAMHGVIKEFVPLTTTEYRGYGEDNNGSTVLYFDMSTKCGATATVVSVDPSSGQVQDTTSVDQPCGNQTSTQSGSTPNSGSTSPQGTAGSNACAGINNTGQASNDQLMNCDAAARAELNRRLQQATQPSASASAKPSASASHK